MKAMVTNTFLDGQVLSAVRKDQKHLFALGNFPSFLLFLALVYLIYSLFYHLPLFEIAQKDLPLAL